jgi:hypothetical protein
MWGGWGVWMEMRPEAVRRKSGPKERELAHA